jgi:hypothetical protein
VLDAVAARRAGRQEGRRVRVVPLEVDGERAAILQDRAAKIPAPVLALRGSFLADERILAVHRAVVKAEPCARTERPDPRLRDDVDEQPAGAVVFRGELVAGDPDHFDLRLRRQLLTLEAVDAHHGTESRHILELAFEFVGILRQRLDLLARENRAERQAAIGRSFLPIAAHRNGVFHFLERHNQDVLVVARANPDVAQQADVETGKFTLDRVPAGLQPIERRQPLFRCFGGRDRHTLGGALGPDDRYGGALQHASRRIDHGHEQPAIARRRLRVDARSARDEHDRGKDSNSGCFQRHNAIS